MLPDSAQVFLNVPATMSATFRPNNDQESLNSLINIVNTQIQIIGVISAIFLSITTIILAIIAFLVWKSYETRKKVEEDAKAIENSRVLTEQLVSEIIEFKDTASKTVEAAQKQISLLKVKENKESTKKIALEELDNTIKKLNNEINSQTYQSTIKNIFRNLSDNRYSFFISPSLLNYLDQVAINKKIPRSVYLRQLIENDMEKNIKK